MAAAVAASAAADAAAVGLGGVNLQSPLTCVESEENDRIVDSNTHGTGLDDAQPRALSRLSPQPRTVVSRVYLLLLVMLLSSQVLLPPKPASGFPARPLRGSEAPSSEKKALDACSSLVDGNANCGIMLAVAAPRTTP